MSAPCTGICSPWATVADVCEPCSDYTFPQNVLEDALTIASELLFNLTGRQWPGSCSDVVRPNARFRANDNLIGFNGAGSNQQGNWWQLPMGFCTCQQSRGFFGCTRVSEITLGGAPVTEIIQVKQDGVVLQPSQYRVDDYRYLVRLPDADGSRPGWPCCQDPALDDTQPGTWSVTFAYGTPPPAGGVRAAARLGCEIAMACTPELVGRCRLPARTTAVLRQGVNTTMVDPKDFIDNGRTGLPDVDLWIKSVNPAGLRRRAQAMSPDIDRRVRRAGT